MLFYKIDEQGAYLDLVLLDTHPTLEEMDDEGNSLIDPLYISTPIPNDLYFGEDIKPKWNFEEQKWVEGATQEEIDELTKPQPHEPTEIDLLHAQVKASSDYVDLLEEVVVELIQEVYK